MMTGKIVVGDWKTDKNEDNRPYLEVRVYPTTNEPKASASGKSLLKAYDQVALPNGDKLTATLITPLKR